MAPTGVGMRVDGVRLALPHPRDHELALMDALEAAQLIGELRQIADRPAKHHHLQALVMVQVDMERGNHLLGMVVLELHQSIGQMTMVVVVDQCEGSDRFAITGILDASPSERLAEDLPHAVAAAGKPPILAVGVKLIEQRGLDRNRESRHLAHGRFSRVPTIAIDQTRVKIRNSRGNGK